MSPAMLRFGYVADGVFKVLVGLAAVALSPLFVAHRGAPALLLGLTAVAVLSSAAAEITYGMRVADSSHIKYLAAYDTGWVMVSIGAALLFTNAPGPAWALWLGYQLLFSPIVAVIFGLSARRGHRERA